MNEKSILLNLLYDTDLSDTEKQAATNAINDCPDYKTYQAIQYRLENRRKPLDQIVNPTQKDISKHLKKSL
jgi:hypothetical protein